MGEKLYVVNSHQTRLVHCRSQVFAHSEEEAIEKFDNDDIEDTEDHDYELQSYWISTVELLE